MATIYINTSGDWDALTSAAVDLDTVVVQSGATATINNSVKFLPTRINVYDGAIHINGAGATCPITLPFLAATSWYIGTAGKFNTTAGWHSVGTCHGTAYSDFDLTDYWYKTTTGGSSKNDVADYLPAIWVETGREVAFTGGTGTLPSKFDYLHNTSRVATVALNSSAGTNYGPVESVGTVTGDPTQGTIVLKWLLGTNSVNDPIEIRKVADENGPIYKTTWSGTISSAPVLRKGIYSAFQNSSGTKTGHVANITMSTMGDGIFGHQFHTYPLSTKGTFGDGVNGILPAAGADIRLPRIRFPYINNVTRRNTGLASVPLNNTVFYVPSTSYGEVNLDGVTMGNSQLIITNIDKVSLNNIAASQIGLTAISPPTIGTYSNICVGNPSAISPTTTLTINDTVLDDMFVGSDSNTTHISVVGRNINICHSKAWHKFNVLSSYFDNISFSGYNNGNQVNDIHNHGVLTLSQQQGFSIRDYVSVSGLTGGTNTATSSYMIHVSSCSGDFYVENLRLIGNSYKARTGINLSSSYLTSLKLRAIGNPAYKEQWFAGTDMLLIFSSFRTDLLDIARVFLEPVASRYLFNQGGITVYISSCNITDVYSGYGSTLPYIIQTKSDGYIKNAFNPYNVNYAPCVVHGVSTVQKAQARSFGSYFTSATTGQIQCKFYNNASPSYNNFEIIQTGTSGEVFSPVAVDYYTFKAGSIVEFTSENFIKGHTGFTGDVSMFSNGNSMTYNWTGGTVGAYFKYDTAGTGFNNTWLYTRTPGNWTGLSIDPAVGVKLKLRLEASDTDAKLVGGFSAKTTTSTSAWLNNLEPIDQTTTTITLQNMVVGSRYWVYNLDSSALITSGVAASSTVSYDVNNLPNGTNLKVRVRYASSTTKYLPFETNAITSNLQAAVFISQVQDTIIT